MRYRCVRRVRKTIRPDCWRGESKRTKSVKRKENTRNGPDQQRRSAHVCDGRRERAGDDTQAGTHTHSRTRPRSARGVQRPVMTVSAVDGFLYIFPVNFGSAATPWRPAAAELYGFRPRLPYGRTRVVDASAHTSLPATCATTYVAGWPP